MIESFYIKALIYSKNYTEFNCMETFFDFSFVRQLNALQRKKKETGDSNVGFGASGVGFGAADVGLGGQKCGARPPSLRQQMLSIYLYVLIVNITLK